VVHAVQVVAVVVQATLPDVHREVDGHAADSDQDTFLAALTGAEEWRPGKRATEVLRCNWVVPKK